MSLLFVNVANPNQKIKPKVRSHVMRNIAERKHLDHQNSLLRTSELNKKRSCIVKSRPQKNKNQDDRKVPHDASWNSLSQLVEPPKHNYFTAPQENASDQQNNRISKCNQSTTGMLYKEAGSPRRDSLVSSSDLILRVSSNGASPQPCIGSEIDPFHTLPQLPNTPINIERLKKHCFIYFGSDALARFWVPIILKTRHSFLSCMCLGSNHHDIMRGLKHESATTIALKTAVITEINNNLIGLASQVNDLTIIAISQLLAAEVVSGDKVALKAHIKGLEMILIERGGLDNLGMNGLLESILSIIVFLAHIMHGIPLHDVYSAHLPYQLYLPISAETIIESPIFCPRGKFVYIPRSRMCSEQTCDILSDMRDLTTIFFSTAEVYGGPREAVLATESSPLVSICERTIAHPSASEPGMVVANDWVYESCRLAALVHCYMIYPCIPLLHPRTAVSYLQLVFDLQNALAKTDISICWGDMVGALYWCTLVGGAIIRDVLEAFAVDGRKYVDSCYRELEYCRKWLTVLAARLSVVLGFQNADAVTTTLRRFICIRDSGGLAAWSSHPSMISSTAEPEGAQLPFRLS